MVGSSSHHLDANGLYVTAQSHHLHGAVALYGGLNTGRTACFCRSAYGRDKCRRIVEAQSNFSRTAVESKSNSE